MSTETAWAAGFFDGEGNARLDGRDGRLYLVLSIGQISREPLDRFRNAVGNLGVIYGPYDKPGPNGLWQPVFTYKAMGKPAQAVAAVILPYVCSIKREQISVALAGEVYRGGLDHKKLQTHCKHGHEYTADNTYMWHGWRHCRQCNKAQSAKRIRA